jgi:hypothetical protein
MSKNCCASEKVYVRTGRAQNGKGSSAQNDKFRKKNAENN